MEQDIDLRLSIVQYDIAWENKTSNMAFVYTTISQLEGKTDLIVLPEMFSTGFSMNSRNLAETTEGETIAQLKEWAERYDVALCGSFIAVENNTYFNRGFFITPNNEYYYDKRHLFRMGMESESFSSGSNQLIVKHKGFNICLLICYDLRFPVWARNVNNEYDLLVYVANWPASRIKVWNTLLTARALENMCYVCGVNRIGVDGSKLKYDGGSRIIDAKGEDILKTEFDKVEVKTCTISKTALDKFRNNFPVWKDADKFTLL